jgi:uncharacterized delta-60 repeat protein
VIGMLCAALPSSAAAATSGSLDSSFGSSGYASTPYGSWAAAAATVVQSNGHVVTAGVTDVNGAYEIIATRYTATGQPDGSFGSGGVVVLNIGGYASVDSGAALALQPDGKILIAGTGVANWHHDFAVVRLNRNGSLDRTFGSAGIAALPVGEAAFANAVLVDPTGKIDVAGTTSVSGTNHFFVARLTSGGALDSTFGSGGVAVLPTPAAAWGMALQPNGSLVIAGEQAYNSSEAFIVQRVRGDGSLESSFGTGGVVTIPIGSWAVGYAMALQPDGKIVVGGNGKATDGSPLAAVVRLNPDGALDSNFASGGILQFPGGGLNALTIDSAARIYLVGVGATVIRLNPNGSADSSFASGGFGIYCNGTSCAANGVAIDPTNGDLVLAGITHLSGVPEIMALRLFP